MNPIIHLQRSKRREVSFPGVELVFASNKEREGDRRDNWTTVRVCSNDLGGYYVGIGHLTTMHGRTDFLMAEAVRTVKEAIMFVRRNAPEMEDEVVRQLQARREPQNAAVHQR
jgi:hypothetical protein